MSDEAARVHIAAQWRGSRMAPRGRAQQPGRVRRIGMLVTLPENDPEETARNAILLQSLEQMGWTVGRNVQFDRRQTLGDAERARRLAVELISLMPDGGKRFWKELEE